MPDADAPQAPDGAAALRSLAAGRSRRPPIPARHPRPPGALPASGTVEDVEAADAGPPVAAPEPAPRAASERPAAGPALPADAAQINLGLRVRQPVDDRFSRVVARLRENHGLRATKTEVLEMLLWDLPTDAGGLGDLAARVRAFRAEHPRR
ncbi:MAG: hypothetical protein MUE51_15070 [Thermoleophilia bacterium]|nr:hypothetical protein [Thermoleophilia bacterium]